MSFPWKAFARLAVASLVGMVGLIFMARLDAWIGLYGDAQTTAQVLHHYTWKGGAKILLIGYFASVGYHHHLEGALIKEWCDENPARALGSAFLQFWLTAPAAVMLVLHLGFNVDWQFWPADLYVLMVTFSQFGYWLGGWANRRRGRKPATN